MTMVPVVTDTQQQMQDDARRRLLQSTLRQRLAAAAQPAAVSPVPPATDNPLGGTPLGQGTFAAGVGEGLAQGLKGFAGLFTGKPATPYDRPFAPASGFAQQVGRSLGTMATLGMGVPQDPYAGLDYSRRGNYGLNVPTLLNEAGYYAPAGAEAAMVGPAFKGYAGAAAQRTGQVVGAAIKGGERGFASFGDELSNVDKELASLDQRIAATARAGQDTTALQSERTATQELRQNTIEARMTDEQVSQYQDLKQRQQELQGQLDAQAMAKTANIVRPPKATSGGLGMWSNAKLKALADHEGVDPYKEDWWDSLDSKVVAEFRRTRIPTPPVTAVSDLRQQLSEVNGQLKDFESGKYVTPASQPTGTAIQAGMGIGEKPAQGQLLGEFQGKAPEQTPLIDAAQVQAKAAQRAQVVAGQGTLPETPVAAPPQRPPIVPPTATGGVMPPSQPPSDPFGHLLQLVQDAKPVRAETEVLKSQELKKRVAVYAKTLQAGEGRTGFQQARGALTGQLPVAQFTPPMELLSPAEQTALHNHIRDLPNDVMQVLTKGNASDALEKVLHGQIPTEGEIGLLEKAFGPELAQALLQQRTGWQKFRANLEDALNIPRSLMSTADFSAVLRQGAITSAGHPIAALRALGDMGKSWWSEDLYQAMDTAIKSKPSFAKQQVSGLYLADIGGKAPLLSAREEAFMSRLIGRVPLLGGIVRKSERAYVSYLNKLRSDVFDLVAQDWEQERKTVQDYKQLAGFLNNATGRGSAFGADKAMPFLSAVFYSPRFLVSRVRTPLYVFSQSKPVRMEAAKELTAFVGTGITVLALGKYGGLWNVELDPRSSDFGKGKIGPTRFDFWAGYQPLARYTTQIMAGQRKSAAGYVHDAGRLDTFMRFLRSKLAPAPGLGADVLAGENFVGQEFSGEPLQVLDQAYQRLAPLFIQDVVDAARLQGPGGVALAAPGALGVGVQSYQAQAGVGDVTSARVAALRRLYPNRPNLQYGDLPSAVQRRVDSEPEVQAVVQALGTTVRQRMFPTPRERAQTAQQRLRDKMQRLRGILPTLVGAH